MKRISVFAAVLCTFVVAQSLEAAVLNVSSTVRPVSVDELNDDAGLAGHEVYEFFVSTDTDILQVDTVEVSQGPLYQNGLGSDDAEPLPAFVAVFPALGADSYITTPGGTAIAGGGFGDNGAAWFDSDNNGPQANFKFAQLTVPANTELGWFTGRILTQGVAGPEAFQFSLPIPEPGTLALAGLGLIGIVAGRRRS